MREDRRANYCRRTGRRHGETPDARRRIEFLGAQPASVDWHGGRTANRDSPRTEPATQGRHVPGQIVAGRSAGVRWQAKPRARVRTGFVHRSRLGRFALGLCLRGRRIVHYHRARTCLGGHLADNRVALDSRTRVARAARIQKWRQQRGSSPHRSAWQPSRTTNSKSTCPTCTKKVPMVGK